MRRLLFAALTLLIAPLLRADDIAESRRLQRAAVEAYQAKDHAAFLENIRKASALRPQHPTLLYQFAGALQLNGKHEEALRILERVARMGFVYDVARDFEDARYAPVAKLFDANRRPIGTARSEAVIPRTALIPEGMAWDGKRFFVSSVRTKSIFVIGPDGTAKPFAETPYGAFGMAVDRKRGILWATTTALPQVDGFDEADRGRSALLKIDAATGRVLETIGIDDGAEHHLGDVTVAPDGEVYVSDGRVPVIWRVEADAAASRLVPFVRGPFQNLQGLAVAGTLLYVADYATGIHAIDRRTGDVRTLPVPPDVSLLGIDGLYAAGPRALIATQNGTNPNRVLRIELAAGGLRVVGAKTLLANSELMGDPTLGVIAGGRFHFNANAQWDQFGEDGRIADPLKLREAVVVSVPLR